LKLGGINRPLASKIRGFPRKRNGETFCALFPRAA